MKNIVRFIGIIALVAVIGFGVTACSSGGGGGSNNPTPTPSGEFDASLNGTWVDDDGFEIKISNGTFELFNEVQMKGTITTSGNNFTMTVTHFYGDEEFDLEEKWYSRDEVASLMKQSGASTAEINEELDEFFPTWKGTYSGNKLTMIEEGESYSFTKK